MWWSAELLVNYGEAIGTIVVAGALADWSLNEWQRQRLTAIAARARAFAAGLRQRNLLERFGHPPMRRNFIAAVFACDALIVACLAHHMGYQGTSGTARDVLLGHFLLFLVPLTVAGAALFMAGPQLIAALTGRGGLLVCLGKCVAAAIAAGTLGYGALRVMTLTFGAFGPRALLDWWDFRLSIYAVEYAISGVIVSAMMIAGLLVALLAAAGLISGLIMLVLLQAELIAGLIRRFPRGSLLGSSIAVAGLAILIKDWI